MNNAQWLVELYEYKISDLSRGKEPAGGRFSLRELERELRSTELEPRLMRRYLELRREQRKYTGGARQGDPNAAVISQALRETPLVCALLSPAHAYGLLRAARGAASLVRGQAVPSNLEGDRYIASNHAARVAVALKAATALRTWARKLGEDKLKSFYEQAAQEAGVSQESAQAAFARLNVQEPPILFARVSEAATQLRLYHHSLQAKRLDSATVQLSQLRSEPQVIKSLGFYVLRDGVAAVAVRPQLIGALYQPHIH